MRRVMTILFAAALLQGCAHRNTGIQCEDNFNTSGGFIAGKTYNSSVVFDHLAPEKAFHNAQKALLKEGFSIDSADDERGIISAHQGVIMSTRTAPMSIVVEEAGKGSKVSYIFTTAGGMYTTDGVVRDGFCRLADGMRE